MKTMKICSALLFVLVTLFSCQKEGITDLNSDSNSGLNGARRANNCATCLPSWTDSRETFNLPGSFNQALNLVAEQDAAGLTYLHLTGTAGFTELAYTVTFYDVSAGTSTLLLSWSDPSAVGGSVTDRDLFSTKAGAPLSIANFPAGWEACDYISVRFTKIGGVGFGSQVPPVANYYLSKLCPPPVACATFQTETAYGGNNVGTANSAWWYYFNVNGATTQTIYAGQTINVGTINYTGSSFVITLTGGWELAPGTESVKVQGLNTLPGARPIPGQSDKKGSSLTVDLTGYAYPYYAVHLDVRKCSE